ncbi:hypothetical protein Q4Q52_19990 [Shewanella sp. SP1S2-4]|uniref:hypothetical protein n=1 Tax=Shewanella sp. SP1S2-4 TaxID=3063537 RepID=UPI00288FE065|nr:hypothetical protein [Shewanella sp. SP1S2-4]MDT3322020.1 hypothetical protein [Shewanella sp. SP1S2-4]
MFDLFYSFSFGDHNLDFNGIELIGANYEPDWGVLIDIEFGHDYFVTGDSYERIEITTKFRGLRGTAGYQVDLFIGSRFAKTMMVQTSPIGEIFTDKADY